MGTAFLSSSYLRLINNAVNMPLVYRNIPTRHIINLRAACDTDFIPPFLALVSVGLHRCFSQTVQALDRYRT
jgi:hypothetical protein